MTRIVAADEKGIALAVEAIRAGGVVAFPTETFYGLAVDPWNEKAVGALYNAKGRPPDTAVALIADSEKVVREKIVGGALPAAAEILADKFWPGPLTIIVPARATLSKLLGAGTGTIGVRVSPHPVAAALAAKLGAITATSANPHGMPAMTRAADVAKAMPNLALVLDGGETSGAKPSTLVDLTIDPPRVVRAGAIGEAAIRAALAS